MYKSAAISSFKNTLKGRTFVIAPLSRQGHCKGAQVQGAHQAASHIPALNHLNRSQYSFTDQ